MPDWLQRHLPEGWTTAHLIWLSVGLFVVTFIGSILAVGWAVVKIPADFFVDEKAPLAWRGRHPIVRWPLLLLKNLLGFGLIVLGVIMSLPSVPGQGILTILIGAMLTDFSGKRSMEHWLLSRRGVLNAINRLRARYAKEPLRLEEKPNDGQPSAIG